MDESFLELDAFLRALPTVTAQAAQRAIIRLGLLVFAEAQKLVPVDTGLLRSSGRVYPVGEGWGTVVWIEYPVYYAIYVHEDLTKYHRPPTQAKFVETPLRRYRQVIPELGSEILFDIIGPRYATRHSI